MKKAFVFLRSLALIAFVLGLVGIGTSRSQDKPAIIASGNACIASEYETLTNTQHEEEDEFFIIGCGGFL